MAVFGSLSYSITNKTLVLSPEFLTISLGKDEDTLELMTGFWDDKIYKCTFKKIAIGLAMGMASYFLIYLPIKSLWQRYKAKFKEVSSTELDSFKRLPGFEARV
jgi:hypothetical protein